MSMASLPAGTVRLATRSESQQQVSRILRVNPKGIARPEIQNASDSKSGAFSFAPSEALIRHLPGYHRDLFQSNAEARAISP